MTLPNIDEQIRRALAGEDAALYEKYAVEPSLLGKAMETFRTQDRLATIVVVLYSFVFLGLTGFAIWKFSAAEDVKSLMGWMLLFLFGLGGICMIKIWSWMEIQKNNVTREVKRLELQVARLSQRLGEGK